jgi:hypothetical protein
MARSYGINLHHSYDIPPQLSRHLFKPINLISSLGQVDCKGAALFRRAFHCDVPAVGQRDMFDNDKTQ